MHFFYFSLSFFAMSQGLKYWLSFFCYGGIEFKSFSGAKSKSEKILSLWSIVLPLLYAVFAIFMLIMVKVDENNLVGCVKMFIVWSWMLGILLVVFSTAKEKNNEKKFWETVERVEANLGCFVGVRKFNHSMGLKIWTLIVSSTSIQIILLIAAITRGDAGVTTATLSAFIPRLFFWFFTLKFVFYVDVLSFILRNLKLVNTIRITIHDFKQLGKCYMLCWRMSRILEDIFGWSLIFTSATTTIGLLQAGYLFSMDLMKDGFYVNMLIQMALIVLRVWVIADSCEKCSKNTSAIATTIFSINSQEFHSEVEGLGLQLLHQQIVFAPKNLFEINRASFMQVSRFIG